MNTTLKEAIRTHFEERLAWQQAHQVPSIEIETTKAALWGLDNDSIHPVAGALVCDMVSPRCLPIHAERAGDLNEQLVAELDQR